MQCESCCGCYNIEYCLYLCMFNAVLGFNYGAEVSPTPFDIWSNFNMIPDTIKIRYVPSINFLLGIICAAVNKKKIILMLLLRIYLQVGMGIA